MSRVCAEVRLIVNADDFGLTQGINQAIWELAAAGAVTSATLMACGVASDQALEHSLSRTQLAIGCHVVLVDGTATSPSSNAALYDSKGRFYESLARFSMKLQSGRIPEEEIEHEAEAQIRHLQSAGVRVTHVDTHKHTHLFPRVARPLMRAAVRCGITAIRNPFEPAWSARLTRGALLRRIEVTALRGFQDSFQRLCQEFGVRSTDGSIGVSAVGKLDATAIGRLLHDAPSGTWELVCHPGYQDAALSAINTRLRSTRETERKALLTQIPEAVNRGRVQAISFDDL